MLFFDLFTEEEKKKKDKESWGHFLLIYPSLYFIRVHCLIAWLKWKVSSSN